MADNGLKALEAELGWIEVLDLLSHLPPARRADLAQLALIEQALAEAGAR